MEKKLLAGPVEWPPRIAAALCQVSSFLDSLRVKSMSDRVDRVAMGRN
jgi:hypothetical protein